jgi:regulator of PEP synthase PpsR (kinase-PPPase family)
MQINQKTIVVHLVSDSTGEVLGSVSRFLSAIYFDVSIKERYWYLTKTQRQVEDIITEVLAIKNQGLDCFVLHSFKNHALETQLEQGLKKASIVNVSATKYIARLFKSSFKLQNDLKQQKSDAFGGWGGGDFGQDYFQKIEAIEYTIAHDDGSLTEDLSEAQIVIIGPSRTSKTPVSIYLAYRGFKVCNIPFVSDDFFDVPYLKSLKNAVIVGLTINPERLEGIRQTRLNYIQSSGAKTDYVDIAKIKDEIQRARRLYSRLECFVIDVTQKSVEETAAYIASIYQKKIE